MILFLKRFANPSSFFNRGEPISARSGWNGLPEDIFILLITHYLGVSSTAAHCLSQTCRAYNTFSRPHLIHTMCIVKDGVYSLTSGKWSSRVQQMRHDLKRMPQFAKRIGTLRIIDDNPDAPVVCMLFQISGVPGGKPKLTKNGELLVSDLSRHYPNLKTFELPLLQRAYPWAALSRKLQDAVCGFLQRHAESLQEISITTQYPLELVKHCSALVKLEYRIDSAPDSSLGSSIDGGLKLLAVHMSRNPHPVTLTELVVMDSGDSALPAGTARPGLNSESCISLKRLDKVAYYSDNRSSTYLPNLLGRCSVTLTSLSVYVSCHVEGPQLDLSALRHLKHLTLSTNRMSMGIATLSWVSRTIESVFDLTKRIPPLQTLEIAVKALGRTAKEIMRDMDEGWIAFTMDSLQKAASTSRARTVNEDVGAGQYRWSLRELVVVVCVDERIIPPTGPSEDEQAILVSELRSRLAAAFLEIDRSVTVHVELVQDKFYRWLRYPSIPHAPFHY